MITDDNLILCGGEEAFKSTDIYNFNDNTWKNLADMNKERRFAGICVDQNRNKKIYIGGGTKAEKHVEYYDIFKDKWVAISEYTVGEHRYHPIIWTENNNIINIASSWCKLFEKIDFRENKWNVYIGNDDSSFDNIFGKTIKERSNNRLCL